MLIAHSEPHREFHRVPKELAVPCVPGKYYRSSRSLAAPQPLLKAAMRRVKLGRGIGTFCNGLKGSTQCQNIVSAARRKECDNNKNVGGHHRRHPPGSPFSHCSLERLIWQLSMERNTAQRNMTKMASTGAPLL